MMLHPSDCFFTAVLEGEGASSLVNCFSPGAAADILEVQLTSTVFKNDIEGIEYFDRTVASIKALTGVVPPVEEEQFNPFYLPCKMEKVDEVLDVDVKLDGWAFEGLDGNPYTIKHLRASDGDELLFEAALRYQQFKLPTYSELAEYHSKISIN